MVRPDSSLGYRPRYNEQDATTVPATGRVAEMRGVVMAKAC